MKAVLFDLDDTLVDHQHSYRSSLAAVQTAYPALQNQAFDDLERVHNYWLNQLHAELLAGRYTLDVVRIERLRQTFLHCGTALSDAELAQAVRLQRDTYQRAQRPVAGVVDLLKHLKTTHVKIGVVTNHLTAEQQHKLRHCQLEDYVDAMVTSEDVGLPKPDPAMFHAVLEQLDCRTDEVVMIGDSWESDVRGRRTWASPCCG